MITQTLDLNLIPGRVLPMVNVSQYDKDSRTLEFTIYNGDQTFDLTGLTAYIQGLKPDGHGFNYSATIADGKVTANVEEQMTVVAGRVMCEIILMDGTDRAGTGNFILNVEAAAMPDGSNMSDSDYSYIEQLIEDAQAAQTEAEESAEDAEAWAVGERGGVPVGPTDPTYHNNAHYWAMQSSANDMTGATALTPGVHGLVPAPAAGDQDKFLTGAGTWEDLPTPSSGGHTIQNPSGMDMTQRSTLQFTGSGVTVSDDAINDKTVVGITAGGLLPHLVITSEAGATITITKDGTTISATETTSGTFEVDVPDFGTWTIIMNYGGDTYNQNVTIDTVKIYTTTIMAFSATILVTYPSGATCTCTGNGQSYTASGTPYNFIVRSAGTYTITVTMDGASKTASVTITSDGQSAAETIKFGTINLTVDNDFIGETISCVNGGTTITKTASSTSVTFRPPTTGTWTISGTVNGTTYTTTATVSDLDTPVSATLNVHVIPDGSSVTPTDDVQTWLNCANIWDKNYTTVAEILADSTTLLALMSDNNAADYLVRSTTWASTICADATAMTDIGANNYAADALLADSTWLAAISASTYFESVLNVKVPVMTSNTTPSGVCTGTGNIYTTHDYYCAFDGSYENGWQINQNATSNYFSVGYEFTSAVKCYVGYMYASTNRWGTWKLQAFDGSSWIDKSETIVSTVSDLYEGKLIFTSPAAYSKYRFYGNVRESLPFIQVLQFYGRANV